MRRFPILALSGALFAQVPQAAGDTLIRTTTIHADPPRSVDSYVAVKIVPILLPRIEFAVINAPDADYLQSEFSGLPSGTGVRVDSVSVLVSPVAPKSSRVNLEVHWRWAESGRDSIFPASRRMQFIDKVAPYGATKLGATALRDILQVDSIWTCQNGRCVIAPAPRKVENYTPYRIDCFPNCMPLDSAQMLEVVRARLRYSGVAMLVHPLSASVKALPSSWRQTTGGEDMPSLCAALPGNLANWISEDFFQFSVNPVAYTSLAKPNIPRTLHYRTGPASYVYDRTASPNLKILETQDVRVVNDTLVKFGKSLHLQGSNKIRCGVWLNDSLVIRDSWFVLPDSTGSAEAIEAAMFPGFCRPRDFAWRLSGDTVWLGNDKWPVLVQDLLRTASIDGKLLEIPSGDAPRLVGSRLELAWGATVVARDLSGRRLGTSSTLEAGSHELDLAGHRGAFVLEIRSLDGKRSSSLRGSAFSR